MMLKKSKISVGLDLGNSSIKLVALQEDFRKSRPKLINYAIKSLMGINEENNEQAIVAAIKELYRETKLDERKVRVALSGNSIIVRYVSFPKMTLDEAKKSVRYEGDQHIPFNIDEVEIDCDILSKNSSGNGRMDVILAAVRKESCQKLVDLLVKAGLIPVVVDVDSIAVVNAFSQAAVDGADKVVALAHLGASNSDISILHDGVPVFTRYIESGGNELTAAIAKGLSMDINRAEELKVFGDNIAKPFADSVLESMARDIRSSFDYYEGMSGLDVSRFYLSGGGALYEDVCAYLESALGIETRFWDPFSRIDTSAFKNDEKFNSISQMLAVAVGLAVRKVDS